MATLLSQVREGFTENDNEAETSKKDRHYPKSTGGK